MSREEDEVQAIERIKGVTDASMLRIVIPTMLGLLSVGVTALGWSVNKVADHMDRIDAFMSASSSDTKQNSHDIADLRALVPQREAQIKEIRDLANKTAWTVDELQRDQGRGRR